MADLLLVTCNCSSALQSKHQLSDPYNLCELCALTCHVSTDPAVLAPIHLLAFFAAILNPIASLANQKCPPLFQFPAIITVTHTWLFLHVLVQQVKTTTRNPLCIKSSDFFLRKATKEVSNYREGLWIRHPVVDLTKLKFKN